MDYTRAEPKFRSRLIGEISDSDFGFGILD